MTSHNVPQESPGPRTKDGQTAIRAFGRSLSDFGELGRAEKILLDCCKRGEVAWISDERPKTESDANRVRAAFIRFLALGGDPAKPVHEHGVELAGAWVTGVIDLAGADVPRRLVLANCILPRIEALGAHISLLALDGSLLLGGLYGDRLVCNGGIFLRNGFHATAEVRLQGATIGGDLDCHNGRFEVREGVALMATSMQISGNVFLRDGFHATGEVLLMGAKVGGDLDCDGASFEATDDAFCCGRARVNGAFFFQSIKRLEGSVLLGPMQVGSLRDDTASWALARGRIMLDGFVYDRLSGEAPTDAVARIAWLDSQRPNHLGPDFRPQPWEQLIAVLRAMGHPEAERTLAVAKQDRLRKAGKVVRGARTLHFLYGLFVGYGYRPFRLLATTAVIWLFCATAFWAATNPQWFGAETHLLVPSPPESGRHPRPADYSNFVPLIYSADVLLPVVDLSYKKEWQPIVADDLGRPLIWGQLLRFLYWFEIAFGWIAGLLLVGVLGSLIKKD